MKKKVKTRSGTFLVFLFFFLAIAAISSVEAYIFYGKFTSIDILDNLHNRINHISRTVAKLGNTFDIVIIGGGLEQTTVNIFHSDIERIDKDINETVSKYSTTRFFSGKDMLNEDLKKIPVEWRKIYNDIKKLSADIHPDKLLLVHNDIDIDVIVLDERLDRISAGINTALQKVLRDTKLFLLVTLAAFVLMLISASIFLFSRFISPLKTFENDALQILSTKGKASFAENMDGVVGRLAHVFNTILQVNARRTIELEETLSHITSELKDKESAIENLGAFFTAAGSSFESSALYKGALSRVPGLTGAAAVLLYIKEDGELVLKAFVTGSESITGDAPPLLSTTAALIGEGELVEAPSALRSMGASWLRSFSIGSADEGYYGRVILLFNEKPPLKESAYVRSLTSAIGTFVVFIERLKEERESGKDCRTLINQLPFGVAVFGKDGRCKLVNLLLKRFLGAAPDFDFTRDYTFTDDNVFITQGLVTTIKKSYDGFITEFIINYDPYLVKRFGFMGESRDLKINVIPIYDPDGTISKIALLYKDITNNDVSTPPEVKKS